MCVSVWLSSEHTNWNELMGTACHVVTHSRPWLSRLRGVVIKMSRSVPRWSHAHAPPARLQCRSESDALPACSQLESAGIVCFCNATLLYSWEQSISDWHRLSVDLVEPPQCALWKRRDIILRDLLTACYDTITLTMHQLWQRHRRGHQFNRHLYPQRDLR